MESVIARAALSPRVLAALTVLVLGTACSLTPGELGGEGSDPRCPDCTGEDGGDPAPSASDGATVAFLSTGAPTATQFLLRGTIPVPPRTYPRLDGRDPFKVLDYDGTPLPTQTEIVSRYPDEADGADVVEVLAMVHRDPAIVPGTQVSYAVRQQPHPAIPGAGTVGLEDLEATENLPGAVHALLSDPDSIEIVAYDCFGNRYAARPLDGTGAIEIRRHGRVQSELRIYQQLKPTPFLSGASGTLPHLLGVHVYLSTFAGSEIVGMDVRFNNGHSGRDSSTTLDDPLGKIYFARIEVDTPGNWNLIQDFPDPFFGGFTTSGSTRTWGLVKPNPDGRMHVIRWQGQFHRRLYLCTSADQGLASNYSKGVGHAFCTRGSDPVSGHEYWSWWNRGTARYFPQSYQLPKLDHVGIGNLRNQLFAEFSAVEAWLRDGTNTGGTYPVQSGVLGWGHPYGVSYGGMTSGSEIFMYDGVKVAAAAFYPGYQTFVGTHRMHTDRMPAALYDRDGEPSSVERWLIENGANDYVPFYCYLTPFQGGSYPDPFGLGSAPSFQVNHVQSSGLAPGYEGAHLGFDPHDLQHLIRYTRSAKVLAWLGNDSLAKDDLRMQAENFHLSFHPYRNDSFGGTQTSGMRSLQLFVQQHPGKGCYFGRGEGWGLDCAVAAYALSSPAWRAAKRPWFEDIAEMLLMGQGTCTGFIQAFVSDKAVNGLYRARQLIEQSITENALVGLRERVFRGVDTAHSNMTRDILTESLYAFVGEMSWFPGQNGPWRYTGIGPLDINQPIWCSRSQMPGNAYTAGDTETYQDWSSFAYGYELTGDPLFLDKALEQMPFSSDLLIGLQSQGTNNIENQSATLALAQRLAGQL